LTRYQFKVMYNDLGSIMCASPKGVFYQPLFTGIDYRSLKTVTASIHKHMSFTAVQNLKNYCCITQLQFIAHRHQHT